MLIWLFKQVANRDQVILKLQTDLDTTQEKYTGCVEEVITQNSYLLPGISKDFNLVLGDGELVLSLILLWLVAEHKRRRGHKVK